jgi:oligoendopeptidase F
MRMHSTDPATARKFVPAGIDVSKWEQLEPLFKALQDRAINSPADLEKWLADFSELSAVVDEYGSRRYIDKSCNTESKEIEAAFMHFVENIEPKIKPVYFELQKKFIASPHRKSLTGKRFDMLNRNWQSEVELFRQENVDLETQVTKLVNEYDKIFGSMMVDFRGQTYTPQQMARFLEDTDRTTREEAWRASTDRRLKHRSEIDKLYDDLRPIRDRIAKNAGLSDYRAYAFKAKKRFDYSPEDCFKFADAVEQSVMPVLRQLQAKRRKDLKLDKLRPWDTSVDPQNRPPLRPFDPSQIDSFVGKTRSIFERLSPDLATDFDNLSRNKNLDLGSRKGKQPGGYQISLEESKQPFIFMNAAGLQRDVETLLHEGGHAFHFLWASNNEPLTFLRGAPMEFCEVASMSMELFAMDHFDAFYTNPDDCKRAQIQQLEGNVNVLAWIATIDMFQHWIYTHPNHTTAERTAEWLKLVNRFGGDVDWTGLDAAREAMWQRQLHLFHSPFYYIEYGIAQLGALQLWLKARDDAKAALNNYKNALKLGGTRTLPELFTAAGIQFDFSNKTIAPLMGAVSEELTALGA